MPEWSSLTFINQPLWPLTPLELKLKLSLPTSQPQPLWSNTLQSFTQLSTLQLFTLQSLTLAEFLLLLQSLTLTELLLLQSLTIAELLLMLQSLHNRCCCCPISLLCSSRHWTQDRESCQPCGESWIPNRLLNNSQSENQRQPFIHRSDFDFRKLKWFSSDCFNSVKFESKFLTWIYFNRAKFWFDSC